ncbi:peptidoglycan DD-metalloendopeptidase family protein [Sulfitobacter dubius]|uniref:peptidoglycan DD-metalloendopeptidase family protein n=1 Tax=Sulfitobacter dubius TaxID=218673 RepID=UPI0008EABD1B|nr:peptidoglycan DD-metalloendopeptidase family protein [Sulfitobacter dubius]SFG65616.1 Peptidase family M23 [Sulfitobacter dubius]
MILRAALALTLSSAGPALAEDLQLAFPLDCTLGQDCHIQQYMDRDPSSAAQDYRCSGLTYDGHKGTDFALPDRAAMAAGVTVRAAAGGVVKGLRDGMQDNAPLSEVRGRECGNGAVIDNGNGWETQYCHLKRGSLRVTDGQKISEGDVIGQVGQSGKAAFPHLHLSLRHNGQPVDPFDPKGSDCTTVPSDTLWQDTPPYRAGGLIAVGFADHVPSYAAIKAGDAGRDTLSPDAPAMVIYGYSYGTQKDDVLRLSLSGPNGVVIEKDVIMDKPQAQSFRAIGKRMSRQWSPGRYTGTVVLLRSGRVIDEKHGSVTVQ